MKQYTFNDSDRLKEVCKELSTYVKGDSSPDAENILMMLDELLDLIEIHPRNNLNLCLCGGMETIMKIILNDPNSEVRRSACGILSSAVQNNSEVQKIVKALGVMNLMH